MTTPGFAISYASHVERIIDKILSDMPLADAVASEGISLPTFHKWLNSDKAAAIAYARAVELRADVLADQTITIADSDDDPAKARNRIQARQWLASKLNKRYGDRVDLNVTQTIDIGGTLAEARARLLRPVRDQLVYEDAQVVDLPRVSEARAIDSQSNRIDPPTGDEVPDIFS